MSLLNTHNHCHPRRQFLRKSFAFLGAFAAAPSSAGSTPAKKPEKPAADNSSSPPKKSGPTAHGAEKGMRLGPRQVFDAHLHCPSESGNVWQWHTVTKTFEEFVHYLDRTGVQRGIINSVRCQEAKTPAEFIAGNREVARYVEKYKGRFEGACVVNPQYIDEASYRLKVDGLVDNPKEHTYRQVIDGHQHYTKAIRLDCVEGDWCNACALTWLAHKSKRIVKVCTIHRRVVISAVLSDV